MTYALLLAGILVADPPADRSHWPNPTHPQPVDWTTVGASVIDHSHFLSAPAGKDGHLRAKDGRIETPAGERVRFWGMNVTGATCTPSREDADFLAGLFARLGINRVRFHHMDATWGRIFPRDGDSTRQVDADARDRLGYFVAALKAKGIYSNINLNVGREYRPGDGVKDHETLGYGKGPTLFDPHLITLQKEYARQLLSWRNPHTGLTFAEDPAVCTVEVLNENSLLEAWANGRFSETPRWGAGGYGGTWGQVPDSYVADLHRLYGEWADATLPAEELAALRTAAGAAAGPIPLTDVAEQKSGDRARVTTDARFLEHLETQYFTEMRRFLRDDLGVQAMLVATSDHSDSLPMYAHTRAIVNSGYDVIHGHGYWQHPSTDAQGRTVVKNDPMVNDPADSTVVQFARTPVGGLPFVISETNHPYPHVFRAEGMPILTTYALLHDWDGIDWFEWGPPDRGGPDAPAARDNGSFRIGLDPVKVAQLVVLAPVWHRQDIQPAEKTLVRHVGEAEAWEMFAGGDGWKRRPFYEDGFDPRLALMHKTVVRFDEESDGEWPEAPRGTLPVRELAPLKWRLPREAVGGEVFGASLGLTMRVGFDERGRMLAALAVSRDGRSLSQANELWVTSTRGSANTGLRFEPDGKTVADWGGGPVLVDALPPPPAAGPSGEPALVMPLSPVGVSTDGGPGTLLWKIERP